MYGYFIRISHSYEKTCLQNPSINKMHSIFKILLIAIIFIAPFSIDIAYAKGKLLIEISYDGLETKVPLEQNDSLSRIVKEMRKNPELSILIEASAYKDYAPIEQLRIISLKRAMEIRKIFFIKEIPINRIAINVLDLESNKDNIIKVYKVEK